MNNPKNAPAAASDLQPGQFEIGNMGGIVRTTVELYEGVNEWQGENGAGKTSGINAIDRALGGDSAIEVRDGADEGYVRTSTLHAKFTKRVQRSGVTGVELIGHSLLSQLIEPGFVDEQANDSARIRALVAITGLRPDSEKILYLSHGMSEVADDVLAAVGSGADTTLFNVGAVVREVALKIAQYAATGSGELTGKLHGIDAAVTAELEAWNVAHPDDQVTGLPDETPSNAERQIERSVADRAQNKYVQAKLTNTSRKTLEQGQRDVRATLGEQPDVAPVEAELAVMQADTASIRKQLAELEVKLRLAQLRDTQQAEKVQRVRQDLKDWNDRRAILDRVVEGATDEELAEAEAAYKVARLDSDRVEMLLRACSIRDQRGQILADVAAIGAREGLYRNIVTELPTRLGAILADAGIEGWSVVDGKIQVQDGDEWFDFASRRSEGQRIIAGCKLWVKFIGEGLGKLDPHHWLSLDTKHRRLLGHVAAKYHLTLNVEVPNEGPLHIAHYGLCEDLNDAAV